MEDGKRYENLAWRLWSRETFCCQPDHITPPVWSLERQLATADDMPELSSSVASDDSQLASDGALTAATRSAASLRPELGRHDSATSQARGKHMTPIDLEKVVNSIHEKQALEPLSPLPLQLQAARKAPQDTTPRPVSPPPTARRFIPESSTSTVATTVMMGSESLSPPAGSDLSTSTDFSSHSVVHGFDPHQISTSVRSSTNLVPPPILKNSFTAKPPPSKAEPTTRKKPALFTLGGSSDEDNSSSFEAYPPAKRSSLSDHLKKSGLTRKTASFKNEVTTRTIQDATSESEEAMESAIESESEDDSDDNAIEEEDSDEEWEDDNGESGPPSVDERPLFQRVDSKPNLTSHRSLLTSMMHQGDRAKALQEAATRASAPPIRRSRTSTPNGPSTGTSPQEDTGLMMRQQIPRTQPIIMTTSNVHPPMLSPRTTRRNMLQTELTQSLRQNLLWERQHKNATTNAVNKRAQSAVSIPALRRAMTTNDIKGLDAFPQQNLLKTATARDAAKNNNSYNDYFDQGLQEYHQKGW